MELPTLVPRTTDLDFEEDERGRSARTRNRHNQKSLWDNANELLNRREDHTGEERRGSMESDRRINLAQPGTEHGVCSMRCAFVSMVRLMQLHKETLGRAEHQHNVDEQDRASFHCFEHMTHERDRLFTVPSSRSDHPADGSTVLREQHSLGNPLLVTGIRWSTSWRFNSARHINPPIDTQSEESPRCAAFRALASYVAGRRV